MLKLYCFITGDDYSTLASDTLKSRKKVALYAWSILIPVLIWLACSYLLVTKVLNGTVAAGIITAVFVSAIVFVIEKSIILSNGGKTIFVFRILLALFVAIIGALIVDEIVFEKDIDQQLAMNQRQEAEAELAKLDSLWNEKIIAQENIVRISREKWDSAVRRIDRELNGIEGTRIPGYGPIAKVMQENAAQYKVEYLMQSSVLDSLKAEYDRSRESEKQRIYASFNNHSLLKRMKAMFDLVKSDDLMLAVYIVFTLIFLFLECMVVIVKMSGGKTNYELKQDLIEIIGARRMERIAGHDDNFFDPAKHSEVSKQLKDIVSKGGSIFN